jgi:hypothetical protein
MFNQAGFNQVPFNRVYGVGVYASFVIDHTNETLVNLSMTYALRFTIDHSQDIAIKALRDRVGTFVMDLANEMVFNGTRDRIAKFDMQCDLTMEFDGSRFRIETIEYTGEFAPGDKIVIDSDRLKLTQNGQNALHLMQGDFFDLNNGPNEITYTDDKTGRTVSIRITHRDRFV